MLARSKGKPSNYYLAPSGIGVPPNGKSANFVREKLHPKGLEMVFLYEIRLKMGQKGIIMDKKRLKVYLNKGKNRVFGPTKPAFC